MSLKSIAPNGAYELTKEGAVLIDIRSSDEYAREHIALAHHVPMERLVTGALPIESLAVPIYYCLSGSRTWACAQALAACAPCDAYMLEGGLNAWKKMGLPVVTDASRPIELQRQVQIAAGSMIVLGALLGGTVSPWFHWLPGLVGSGLVFAGLSGFCGLARVLVKMPWNRRLRGGL